ncbi:hypothetical protein [Pontixanthobacter sp.]|uniref:hypothetical protein n=1 Tax=Pontixanthobacter sp. TaxID=2792078 RepID=UPI003C7BEFB8
MIDFVGEVEDVINEMKLRALVATDTELASALGTTQSNVSTWRKRGAVPKSTLLKFEQIIAERVNESLLHVASRMVAYRLAEYWISGLTGPAANEKRWVVTTCLAYGHFALIRAIEHNIESEFLRTGLPYMEIAAGYIKEEAFLNKLKEWMQKQSFDEILAQST